ncbi:MAG: LPS-assembly protein LptD [Planctomycetes bacterium]|nr:LPS-assembly protein LptD [Planctomycetota bacterium]
MRECPSFQRTRALGRFQPLCVLALNLFVLTLAGTPARAQALSGIAGVELTADRFEVSEGGKVLIAQGNVRASKAQTEVQADNVVVWPEESEMYAEGNVLLKEKNVLSRAERLLYDWKDERALILNSELHWVRPDREINWHLKSPEVERRGPDVAEVRRARVTTCNFSSPHQHFSASKVVFRSQDSVVLHHALFHVHEIPIFYLPYYYRDLKYPWPWFRMGAGSSSQFGQFVQTDLGFEVYPGVDVFFDADYYSERGPAGGVDVEYESDRRIGYLETYFIRDDGEDFENVPLEQEDRYRLKFLHRELILDGDVEGSNAGRWTADMEYHQFSDRGIFQEYFEGEFVEDKEPENRVFVKGDWENTSLSVLGQTQVNQFFDQSQNQQRGSSQSPAQTEYLPRVSLDLLSQPLWDNRLLLTFGTEYSQVDRRFSELFPLAAVDSLSKNREIQRLDFQSELSAPFRAWWLHLEPFVFNRETFYDELLAEEEGSWRTVLGGGVRLSTEFWRTYGYRNERWSIDQLHHVITPEVTFLSGQEVTIDPNELVFFDEMDTEQELDRVNLNLRNLVQTRRGGTTINWAEFEVQSAYFPAENRDHAGKSWSNVETDLRWYPHPKYYFFNDNEIDTDPVEFDVVNIGGSYLPRPGVTLTLQQRYSRDDSNRTIVAAWVQLTEKWGLLYQQDYEWNDHELFDQRVVFRRSFHDWDVELGYDVDQGQDERVFYFFIGPRTGALMGPNRQRGSSRMFGRNADEYGGGVVSPQPVKESP